MLEPLSFKKKQRLVRIPFSEACKSFKNVADVTCSKWEFTLA